MIHGTKIKVSQIAAMACRLNVPTEEILGAYPELRRDQVEAAIRYYENHRDEIRREWAAADATVRRKRTKRKVMLITWDQLDKWGQRADHLGYSTLAEWARVMLLQANRDKVRVKLADSDGFTETLTIHLTEAEHAELDSGDYNFSAWARAALDRAAKC